MFSSGIVLINYRRINNYVYFGPNIMIIIPTNANVTPSKSHAVGLIPSTNHNQKIATEM